jgi:integrase
MGKLTDLQIREWMRKGERFSAKADGDGLYISFRPSDAIPRWLFRYRFGGKARVLDFGTYASVSLADGRRTAKDMKARVQLGYDPAEEKQERKRVAVAKIEAKRTEISMGDLADMYFTDQILGRWKHPNIVRSRIENDIKPNIGRLSIAEVRPSHIDAMLKTIVKRGAPTMANDVLRWTKRIFDYGIKRELATNNPATVFTLSDAGGTEESRDRWLTRDELKQLFEAMRTARGWNRQNTLTVKLLLLLAVRKGELIAAPVAEFDLEAALWHLPAERTKTDAAIDIPLPAAAVAALRELIDGGEGSAWLLPARKMQSRMIPYIDLNTITAALNKSIKPLMKDLPNFTVHDFRRTARTHLEALGVDWRVAERCLNHKIKGVEGIYNRHDFLNERREALNKWAVLLDQLERGEDVDNVVPIKRKKIA